MVEFTVQGPFEIDFEVNKGIKRISRDSIATFWENAPQVIADERGCYVFALRKGRAIKPFYVGKACKNFYQEVFTAHKQEKFNQVLHSNAHGTPIFFFIVHPTQRGKTNERIIDEIETYLIQSALIVNPDLQNIQKTKLPSWTIRNVIKQEPGRSRKSEIDFSRMMGL